MIKGTTRVTDRREGSALTHTVMQFKRTVDAAEMTIPHKHGHWTEMKSVGVGDIS